MTETPDLPDDSSTPEEILLEANIREFGHTISLICAWRPAESSRRTRRTTSSRRRGVS